MPSRTTSVGEVVIIGEVVISPSAERVPIQLTIDFTLNALKGLDKTLPPEDQSAASPPPVAA
jgi:hypothetical protein